MISDLNEKVIICFTVQLRWHPNYEGILAFGTYEGRVGIFDLSQGRTTPTLFKLYHNKAIYKLCWAPPVSVGSVIGAWIYSTEFVISF